MKGGGGYTVRFGSVTDYIGVLGGSFERSVLRRRLDGIGPVVDA